MAYEPGQGGDRVETARTAANIRMLQVDLSDLEAHSLWRLDIAGRLKMQTVRHHYAFVV